MSDSIKACSGGRKVLDHRIYWRSWPELRLEWQLDLVCERSYTVYHVEEFLFYSVFVS